MLNKERFEHRSFGKRLSEMLKVDFRRMFSMPLVYIIVGACFVMPILILVMTTMMDGSISTNPQTGVETVIEGFDNVWQIIGSVSGQTSDTAMNMDITSMCNINMLYFAISVLVCMFVSEDFRSGYSKNLFTVRANKTDYVASKTIVCTVGGALMIIAFIIGAIIGGAIAGLPFDMVGFSSINLLSCLLSKVMLVGIFVPIYLALSVFAKQRAWLSILISLMCGMFLFMMIPMLTPLNATVANIILCAIGSVIFSIGLGSISNIILKKTALV